jgi:hypothetical protein
VGGAPAWPPSRSNQLGAADPDPAPGLTAGASAETGGDDGSAHDRGAFSWPECIQSGVDDGHGPRAAEASHGGTGSGGRPGPAAAVRAAEWPAPADDEAAWAVPPKAA